LSYTGNKIVKQEVFYQVSRYPDIWTNDWIKIDTFYLNASDYSINGTYSSVFKAPGNQGYIKILIFANEDVPGGVSDETETSTHNLQCDNCIRIY